MRIIESLQEIRDICNGLKGEKVVVPTMGALHQGHVALLSKAKKFDHVIATLFVNPLQFNNSFDFNSYPDTRSKDIEIFKKNGVDILFAPRNQEMLDNNHIDAIEANKSGDIWEGSYRPGHFTGVLTIVNRIFELIKPQHAVFGVKDLQQICLIYSKLSLSHNVRIIPVKTARDNNGLAYSSRNLLLSNKGREKASIIFKALKSGKDYWNSHRDIDGLKNRIEEVLNEEASFEIQYIKVTSLSELSKLEKIDNFSGLFREEGITDYKIVMLAGYIEDIRLIDNLIVNSELF